MSFYYDGDHLLGGERRRTWALEKAIEAYDGIPVLNEDIVERAKAFEEYLKGEGDG